MNSRQTSYQNNFWSEIAARKHKGVWLRKHFLMGFTTIYRARFSSFFHLHTRFTWSIWTQAMVLLLRGDLLGNGSTLRRNCTMQNLKLKKNRMLGRGFLPSVFSWSGMPGKLRESSVWNVSAQCNVCIKAFHLSFIQLFTNIWSKINDTAWQAKLYDRTS